MCRALRTASRRRPSSSMRRSASGRGRARQKCFVNFDHRSAGPNTLRWGVEQSRNLMTVRAASMIGMAKITDNRAKARRWRLRQLPVDALGAGDTTVARLVNAYAVLANQGRAVKPTTIDYVQDRHGKVIYRADNRCAVMGNCNAPDWDGRRCRGLRAAAASCSTRWRLPDGPCHGRRDQRGTATVLRDLNRPMFGKTGTTSARPTSGSSAVRRTSSAGVYLGYDNPRPMGGWRPGRPDRRASLEAVGRDRAQGHAEGAVRRAERDPLGAGRSRDRPPVFGSFPVPRIPSRAVIWEAFQPQTEPRRFRRSHGLSVDGQADEADPNNPAQVAGVERRPRVVRAQSRQPQPVQPAEAPLQNQATFN